MIDVSGILLVLGGDWSQVRAHEGGTQPAQGSGMASGFWVLAYVWVCKLELGHMGSGWSEEGGHWVFPFSIAAALGAKLGSGKGFCSPCGFG